MENRVIFGNLNNKLTIGEEHLVEFLDQSLPKDTEWKIDQGMENYNGWLIFLQPYLNGSRPDIVLFNPKTGLLIIEVKDWNLKNYSWKHENDKQRTLFVNDGRGTYPIKSPVKQVNYYKEKLTGQLLPQIGESIDNNKKSYGLIKTAIYFHNASTFEAREFLKEEIDNFKYFPVFGNDLLDKNRINEIVPDINRKSYFWKESWNKEIIFWMSPPFHSIEQGTPLNLNKYQLKYSDPSPGHHRIRGVAGSGKTQVLSYRAANLASKEKNVLILTFNITLWHYIRDMIQRSTYSFDWKHISLNHFHGFCKDILNEYGQEWPSDFGSDESVFRTGVPELILSIVVGKEHFKYDAIYIDEGQDYFYEWYEMLCEFINDRDELVILSDKKQNIYGRDLDWLDKRRKGLEKFGDWIELKTIIRLTVKIAQASNRFSEHFKLNQEVKVDSIDHPNLFNKKEDHFLWWNIDEKLWLDKVDEALNLINKDNYHPSDTVILLPNKHFGMQCVEFYENKKVQVNHVFEDEEEKKSHRHKRSFWMGDGRLKVSTIHSFKGWEVINVILLIPQKYFGDSYRNDSLVYTAMTRARHNLIVINACERYYKFGEHLDKLWV
ncbi:MAG: NERD domain-containing protein [Melioribacteraceae bacterium]|nr:NERD domain-containing protein [Melioribacteraceae bacterium]